MSGTSTLLEAAEALRNGAVSSVELTQASLAAIARLQPRLNFFLAMMDEAALARARQLDEERRRGHLR